MEIQYLGQSCFRIKGKETVLLTDPYDSQKVGFKFPKTTADVVTISHDHYDHNNWIAVEGTDQRPEPFVINSPGEYEVAGISVFGVPSFHDSLNGQKFGKNTIYIIALEGVRLIHLGDLGHKLDNNQLEQVNGADVLFVPVGGTYTLDAKKAAEVVNQIDPSIVIPMHYKSPGLNIELAPVEDFLKEMGREEVKPVPKLVIKDNLPQEQELIILAKK